MAPSTPPSRREFLKVSGLGAAGSLLRPRRAAAQSAASRGMRAPEPNPRRGGTLKAAFGVTTPHFDIQQGATTPVLCHLYNGLVTYNLADGLKTIVPDLAAKSTVSPDGKTYTFELREGVKFHDGSPFSSADVLASFQRIINPPPGIVSQNRELFGIVSEISAPDAKTFRIVLKEPRVYFLQLLAEPSTVVYSKKTLDENIGEVRIVLYEC